MKIEVSQQLLDAQDKLIHAKQRKKNLNAEVDALAIEVREHEQKLAEAESELEQARIDLALDDGAEGIDELKKRFTLVSRKAEKARAVYQEKADLLDAIKNAVAVSSQKTSEIRQELSRVKRASLYEAAVGEESKVAQNLVDALTDFAVNLYCVRGGVTDVNQAISDPRFKAVKQAEKRYREILNDLDAKLICSSSDLI